MAVPVVFFDIAGPDEGALRKFYEKVFYWPAGKSKTFSLGKPAVLQGNIRQDPAEKVLYLGVEDITAKMEEIVKAGGKVDVPRFEVPGVAVLGLFLDAAGNRMGLIEMTGNVPHIP